MRALLTLLAGLALVVPAAEGQVPPGARIQLRATDVELPSCGGCSIAVGVHVSSYDVRFGVPAGWRFERFEATAGTLARPVVVPDGSLVTTTLRVHGQGERDHTLTAVLVRESDGSRAEVAERYQDFDASQRFSCQPAPCSTPGPELPSTEPSPRCRTPSRSAGPHLRVLRPTLRVEGELAVAGVFEPRRAVGVGTELHAAVECTTGAVVATEPDAAGRISFTWSLVPADGRMVRGVHECAVRLTVDDGEHNRVRRGRFRLRIRPDGGVRFLGREGCDDPVGVRTGPHRPSRRP